MFAHLSVNPRPWNLPGRGLRKYYHWRYLARTGGSAVGRLDLHSPDAVADLLGTEGLPRLSIDPAQADAGPAGAMAFVVGLLCYRPDVHLAFPGGLAAGPGGRFCRWLTGKGAALYGLSPQGAANVRLAFAESRAWKAGLAYQARPDIRTAFPLGLTPHGCGPLLVWAMRHGAGEVGFAPEDALWAAYLRDEDPAAGLADTFAVQPRWQVAVPHGTTAFGWPELKDWVAAEYAMRVPWLTAATLPPRFHPWDELQLLLRAKPDLAATFPFDAIRSRPAEVVRWVRSLGKVPVPGVRWRWKLWRQLRAGVPDRPRVTLLGLFRYSSGLQQAATGMSDALTRAGVTVDHRDVPGPAVRDNPTRVPLDRFELADVTIVHTGLDTAVPEAYARAGLHPRAGVYRVATWWWELEQLPNEWLGRGADVDEVWAPTTFIADALKVLGKPVIPMLPGIELPAFGQAGKAAFGMTPGKLTFAVLFDANSRLGRKNPLGAVRAFRRAFAPTDPVELVVKMTPPSGPPAADVLELRRECGAAGVKLVEAVFSRADTLGFLAASDALVSLHRSEGFGLPLAEAMLLGKPVVATGYSGNRDFMHSANSYLVDFERTTIATDDPPYRKGFVWAEPSEEHAAALMKKLAADPAAAKAVGARARTELRSLLSVEAAGRRMRARLAEIARTRATGRG